MAEKSYKYDVVLSFAAKDRKIVNSFAKALTKLDVRVLSEGIHKVPLGERGWREAVQTSYWKKARLFVVFVSRHYRAKLGSQGDTRPTRTGSQDPKRFICIRLDDTKLPGLPPAASSLSIDLNKKTMIDGLALVLDTLGKDRPWLGQIGHLVWDRKYVEYNGMQMASCWALQIRQAQTVTKIRWTRRSKPVKYLDRVKYGDEEEDWGADRQPCHDCLAVKGQYHVPECDVERCPICGGQIISCECPGNLFFATEPKRKGKNR